MKASKLLKIIQEDLKKYPINYLKNKVTDERYIDPLIKKLAEYNSNIYYEIYEFEIEDDYEISNDVVKNIRNDIGYYFDKYEEWTRRENGDPGVVIRDQLEGQRIVGSHMDAGLGAVNRRRHVADGRGRLCRDDERTDSVCGRELEFDAHCHSDRVLTVESLTVDAAIGAGRESVPVRE